MDIDHALGKGPQYSAFQNTHEAGQGHEVNPGFLQREKESGFGLFIQPGAKLAGRDKSGRQAALARLAQDAGVGHITEDDGDLGGDLAGGAGVGDGGGVGTLAGTKEAEPEYFAGTHASYISQIGEMRKMEKERKSGRIEGRRSSRRLPRLDKIQL
jgi:hypothetical protein